MADAAYWPHTGQMARLTRGNIKNFASQMVLSRLAASLDANDLSMLEKFCDQTVLDWKQEFPGVRGYGDRKSTETWDTANTRHELPADFDDLHPSMGGRIVLKDTDGNETGQLEVVRIGDYEQEWGSSGNRYSDRDAPIALLFGVSTNGKRFLEIRPTPVTAVKFDLFYTSLPEVLDNDADQLEAPLGMHGGIQWDLAGRFASFKGNAKAGDCEARAEIVRKRFRSPFNDETRRSGRVLHFEEVGGYSYFNRPE